MFVVVCFIFSCDFCAGGEGVISIFLKSFLSKEMVVSEAEAFEDVFENISNSSKNVGILFIDDIYVVEG